MSYTIHDEILLEIDDIEELKNIIGTCKAKINELKGEKA